MGPTAGWYDDPRDANRLRYWDGGAWTEHVTAKEQAPTSGPPQWQYPGAVQAQQQTWQYGQPPQAPPQPWQQAPGQAPGAVLTPDGAQATTWVKRFAARLLDGIFVFFGSLPFTGYFFYRAVQAVSDDIENGTHHSPFSPSSDVIKWETYAIGIIVVLELCYETFSLRRWGATPGKRLLGISVRRWDQGGQLPWATIARRVGFIYGLAAVSLVPVMGLVASIVGLLDYLWPLWDKRRQALHDKVAATVVIEGARRGSP